MVVGFGKSCKMAVFESADGGRQEGKEGHCGGFCFRSADQPRFDKIR